MDRTMASDTRGRLAGKVAVITGAASGLGRAAAVEFIKNDAKVIIADVQDELGSSVAADLGPSASFVHCDVTDEEQVAAAVDLAVAKHGQLDIFFSNAGVSGPLSRDTRELDLAEFDRTMAVNVRSAVAGLKHAARVMVPRRSGCIIITASIGGVLGGLTPLPYGVSKSAVLGLVRCAAAELSKHCVRVNAISPNYIATPMTIGAMRKSVPEATDEQLSAMVEGTSELAGVVGEASDVAKAAVFLASSEAKYVNGHNLVVDGGCTVFKELKFAVD